MGILNTAIDRKDYEIISTRIIEFPDEYPIAQSGSLIVGSVGHEQYPHVITVNVMPQQYHTYALLACVGSHGTTCIDNHLERFRIGGTLDYRAALSHIMCMAGDSLAIKLSYWDRLPESLKSSFVDRLNVWGRGGIDPIEPQGSFNILQV